MPRTLLLALLFAAAACSGKTDTPANAAPAPVTQKKDPATAKKMIAAGAVVIDVRTPEEFAGGHVPSATDIPIDELPSRLAEVAKLTSGDLTRPMVVYCASGLRAAKAQAELRTAGYTQVVNGGGVDDLQ